MQIQVRYFVLFIIACLSCSAFAGFTNSGTFQTNNLSITTNKLTNNGNLIGNSSVYINATEIAGTGLIKSPSMVIETTVFNYSGTIECLGLCEIYSKNSFNQNMFTRKGNGEIKIIITG